MWGATLPRHRDIHKRRFQSTLPVWGATRLAGTDERPQGHFNPRSPCGERPGRDDQDPVCQAISIHAPRVGSDYRDGQAAAPGDFHISIHAPRVGSDRPADCTGKAPRTYFNPRSPCGERLAITPSPLVSWVFQSTLPVWGATPGALYPAIYGA